MQRQDFLAGLVVGLGVGAGVMYLLDPSSGRRRRALLRDQAIHARKQGTRTLSGAAADLSNRSRGLAASVRSRLEREAADPDKLAARVRARLGRVASNPSAIEVLADGQRVTLSGSVPPEELEDVLDEVSTVKGVREVHNLLQVQVVPPQGPGRH